MKRTQSQDRHTGWPTRPLGDVVETEISTWNTGSHPDEEKQYIEIASIDAASKTIARTHLVQGRTAPSRARTIVHAGDVLVATTRPNLNAVAIVPQELDGQVCSTGFAVLRPTESMTSKWLYWSVRSPAFVRTVSDLVVGAMYPAVTDKQVRSVVIPVPPVLNQQRIVAKLDEQMAALDRAEKALAEQQATASALWQASLGRVFDLTVHPSWTQARLGDVAELNPRRPLLHRSDATLTTFVPMSAVDGLSGAITGSEKRLYGDVKKGYTYFAEGDVLFAKITPCMQNGKHAVASNLADGIGFGSTEFHVIRPSSALTAEWLHLFVRQQNLLQRAVAHFTGAVGQQRVPQDYVESLILPLPPVSEQVFLSEHLTEIRAQLSALKTVLENNNAVLGQLRSRLLDAAFSGEV